MKTVSKTTIALSLMLAFSSGPHVFAATDPDHAPLPAPRDPTHFAGARAFAPYPRFQPAPAVGRPETDGLGRNDDDCKFGCVDH
jgi:hypothetical protein